MNKKICVHTCQILSSVCEKREEKFLTVSQPRLTGNDCLQVWA